MQLQIDHYTVYTVNLNNTMNNLVSLDSLLIVN